MSLKNFQLCRLCKDTCNLEGMCFHCCTWTCEECSKDKACSNCGRVLYD